MKKIINAAARITPVFLALAMFCSSPTDKDLQWRSSVDFPITANKKFFLGAMMDTLFFNHKQVLTTTHIDTIKRTGFPNVYDTILDTTMEILKAYPLYDSVARHPIPDTVAFGFPTRDTATDTISEDSLADKYFSDAFGPIPLSGAPNDTFTIPLAGAYLAAAVPMPAIPFKVKYVYKVNLMDTIQNLNVTVVNNSAANFSSVQITLGSLGTATISNLQGNSTGVAQFNARNKVIDSIMNVSITITPAAAGTFAAGNNLQVMFTLNGLLASKVVVDDYLLGNYTRTFTNPYNLTDTVDVDYIDIDDGFFVYGVTNHTGLDLHLSVTHRNLWMTSFCIQRNLVTVEDLVALTSTDSLPQSGDYNGRISTNVVFPHNSTLTYDDHNISKTRLFAEWDSTTKKSVTKVDYLVTLGTPRHDTLTLSAGDSLAFVIKTVSFKFKEMVGHTMEPYHRTSDISSIPVKLPWSQTVTDSLRGNFVLQKVLVDVGTRMAIPAGAFIDTVRVTYEISSATNPAIKCSDSAVLTHVMRDSLYHRSINITPVVNNYPDSVKVKVALTVPKNTAIKAVNDLTDPTDPAYRKFIGRMVIHGQVDYNLVAPLCWTVADTTVMDLGGTKVDLGGTNGVMGPFARMSDRSASLNIHVTNYTNVYLRLYALLATDSTKVDLLAPSDMADTAGGRYITTNQFTQLINHPTAGYVNILGSGLLIPPRDSNVTVANVIALTEQDLTQILNAKKIGMRWEVRFIPHAASATAPVPDALSNTDWMKLNSWIHIDGVNSIDSLFNK